MNYDNISQLVKIMLKSAFYADESELGNDPYLNYLGLEKGVYSRYIRDGIKDIINLIEEKSRLIWDNEVLRNSLKCYGKINDEIISADDFEILTDIEKEKIKKYIDKVLEEGSEDIEGEQ